MPAITVKNIPDNLYERLKQAAEAHHRSLNGELIHCLEQALNPKPISTAERLARIRALRPEAHRGLVTPEEITEAKGQGRP